MAEKAAASDGPVLIRGPTGIGKEVLARDIHRRSRRSPAPFVVVPCGAVGERLPEIDVFGPGQSLVSEARTGTLFLDHVDELPRSTQSKLVGLLEEDGAGARIIAATSEALEDAPETRFRAALYHELNVFRIDLPALDPDDVLGLASMLATAAEKRSHGAFGADELAAVAALASRQAWRGGARELCRALERYLACRDDRSSVEENWLASSAVPSDPRPAPAVGPESVPPRSTGSPSLSSPAELPEVLERMKHLFCLGVARSEPDVNRLAVACGVSGQTIRNWLRKTGVSPLDLRRGQHELLDEAIAKQRDALGGHRAWLLELLAG